MPSLDPLFADARLRRALHLLNPPGEETRIVGGAVRNALLGLPPGDIDLATTLRPEAVLEIAAAGRVKAVPTGLAHGTITLLAGGLPLEVTTLREDVETDGRHAVVRFGRDFLRDAERRDFTMNALSCGLDRVLHDTTGGLADLAAGRVRFIGDPATRIREDVLRILRFFRFHARFGRGPLDAEGLAAATAAREGLARLSRERIRAELLRLLAAPGAPPVVEAMARAGILELVLRGPADLGCFTRLATRTEDPLLRLAALAVARESDIERLRDALRLSNAERDRLVAAQAVRAELGDGPAPDARRIPSLLLLHGRDATRDGIALARAVAGGEAEAWTDAERLASELAVPVLPYTATDLIARGLKGPALGRALAALKQAFAAAGCPQDESGQAALLEAAVAAAGQSSS